MDEVIDGDMGGGGNVLSMLWIVDEDVDDWEPMETELETFLSSLREDLEGAASCTCVWFLIASFPVFSNSKTTSATYIRACNEIWKRG